VVVVALVPLELLLHTEAVAVAVVLQVAGQPLFLIINMVVLAVQE
jgi:hypothetical protein